LCDEPAATYERASDEHGRLGISGATNRLVPGHCVPTVNLSDWHVAIRNNREYFVVDGPAMTAETWANGGLGA
jgi:hypothetical protein